MANITSLTMNITRVTAPAGNTCTVSYSYNFACSAEEDAINMTFSMSCELWGEDIKYHDSLGTPPYDAHTVTCNGTTQTINRSFTVPCSALDEDWGQDDIFLKLKGVSAAAPGGGSYTIQSTSPTVKGYF